MFKSYLKVVFGLLFCVVIVLAQTGCATIMSGTSQEVLITSEPSGAMVKLNGMTMETPAKFTLNRKDNYVAELSMPGYHKAQVKLEKGVNGWVWGNILFGGIPGLVIDIVSGGCNNINPSDAHINMVPLAVDAPAQIWDAKALKNEAKRTKALAAE